MMKSKEILITYNTQPIISDGLVKSPSDCKRWLSKNTDIQVRRRFRVSARSKTPRSGVFLGAKAYIRYVACREKYHDAVDRSFYDAIISVPRNSGKRRLRSVSRGQVSLVIRKEKLPICCSCKQIRGERLLASGGSIDNKPRNNII